MGLLQKKQFIYKIGTIKDHLYFVYNSCFAAALFSWFWKVFAWQPAGLIAARYITPAVKYCSILLAPICCDI